MNDGAWIGTYTENQGKGGNITILASESVNIAGVLDAGNQSLISAASVFPEDREEQIVEKLGNAGDIYVETKRLTIADGGRISTGAMKSGGGRITLDIGELFYLSGGHINTTVMDGKNNGRDITVSDPDFAVDDSGQSLE